MKLGFRMAYRANTFYMFLKKQSKDYLKEQDISKCEECGGVGLSNLQNIEDENLKYAAWDGSSYCDNCEGIGYLGVREGMQIDLLHYICRNCAGLGCQSCNEGIVDWIDHSMGR